MKEPPRKRKKTYNVPGNAHCLTFSCQRRLHLLNNDRARQWLLEAADRARRRHNVAIWAYVLMPEHSHFLVMPREEDYEMKAFLYALKRPVSWQAERFLTARGDVEWLERLSVQRGQGKVFRFWLPGGGFDRNICSLKGIEGVANYLHANPVRRGLVGDALEWRWSSARWWAGDHSGPLAIDPIGEGF